LHTKIKCCIGGDSDQLSKLELQEVVNSLSERYPKLAIEPRIIELGDHAGNTKAYHNTPSCIANLMSHLLDGDFDALVINAVYLPLSIPPRIGIGAITRRLTPYDVIVSKNEEIFDELPENSTVIANDLRRESQLLYYRPDLKMARSKGSVDSLIQKVKSAKVDAVILSAADVERLQKQDYVAEVFTNSICVPAAGQGSLVVIYRSGDEQIGKFLNSVTDPASYSEIKAERSFLRSLSVGIDDPVGVLGSIEGKRIELEGVLALPHGREKIRSVASGILGREEELGQMLADDILDAGGREILQELNLP